VAPCYPPLNHAFWTDRPAPYPGSKEGPGVECKRGHYSLAKGALRCPVRKQLRRNWFASRCADRCRTRSPILGCKACSTRHRHGRSSCGTANCSRKKSSACRRARSFRRSATIEAPSRHVGWSGLNPLTRSRASTTRTRRRSSFDRELTQHRVSWSICSVRILSTTASRLLTRAPTPVSLSCSLPFQLAHRKQRIHPFESHRPAV
jgi:hypothetical protein